YGAGRKGFQRRDKLPGDEAGGEWHAGDGDDVENLPGAAGAVHPVPQPSLQRMEAAEVLGIQCVLSPDPGGPLAPGADGGIDRVDQPGFRRTGYPEPAARSDHLLRAAQRYHAIGLPRVRRWDRAAQKRPVERVRSPYGTGQDDPQLALLGKDARQPDVAPFP